MKKYCIVFILLVWTSAFSQDQKDTAQYRLQPVTITATRISEPWIQVPLAIDVLQQKEFQHGKGSGLDEVLSFVPGVLAQSRAAGTDIRLSIRGFGARGAGQR